MIAVKLSIEAPASHRAAAEVALVHTDLDRETEEVIADTLQVRDPAW